MILELVLLALAIFLFFKIDGKPKDYPPGPWGLPVVGDVSHMDLLTAKEIQRLYEKYGRVFSIRVGSRLLVFLTEFEIVKTAFNKPEFQGRPDFYTFRSFNYFENVGLVASDGEPWVNGRRFALRHLRDLGLGKTRIQDSVQREVTELIAHYSKHAGKPVEITFELNVAVLNIIWQLVASTRYDVDDKQMLYFTNLTTGFFDLIQGPIALLNVFPWLQTILPRFMQIKLLETDKMELLRDDLTAYLRKIIDEHVKNFDRDDPKDYIDYYLVEMEKEKDNPNTTFLSDYSDLIASIADLFAAGSETTSSTFRWVVLLLAKHPEEQKKAQKLIDEVVPEGRQPCLEDKEHLTYIEAILMETLRFSSFVGQGVPHAALSDSMLDGYKIPKGAVLVPCHQFSHQNSRYFERPDVFYPGHFIGKDGKLLTKRDGYAPFSTGRRQCLGEALSRTELFLFTTSILQKFNILPAPGDPLDLESDDSKPLFNFTKPYKVIFEKRG